MSSFRAVVVLTFTLFSFLAIPCGAAAALKISIGAQTVVVEVSPTHGTRRTGTYTADVLLKKDKTVVTSGAWSAPDSQQQTYQRNSHLGSTGIGVALSGER